VNKDNNAVNPANIGTKASANYQITVPAKQAITVKLRLTNLKPDEVKDNGLFDESFDEVFYMRTKEAIEFMNP
jgi:hypothetical protein